jgi:hypothetical protein
VSGRRGHKKARLSCGPEAILAYLLAARNRCPTSTATMPVTSTNNCNCLSLTELKHKTQTTPRKTAPTPINATTNPWSTRCPAYRPHQLHCLRDAPQHGLRCGFTIFIEIFKLPALHLAHPRRPADSILQLRIFSRRPVGIRKSQLHSRTPGEPIFVNVKQWEFFVCKPKRMPGVVFRLPAPDCFTDF